jgi:uncharacterized membrane protein HdeD (DUF308 family)
MISTINAVMSGAVAMASAVAALFFLRFWRQTRDIFFFFFCLAFAVDAVIRVVLGFGSFSEESEPFIYLARFLSFALIAVAIIRKNRPGGGSRGG